MPRPVGELLLFFLINIFPSLLRIYLISLCAGMCVRLPTRYYIYTRPYGSSRVCVCVLILYSPNPRPRMASVRRSAAQ